MSIFVRCYELLTLILIGVRTAAVTVFQCVFAPRTGGNDVYRRAMSFGCTVLAMTATIVIGVALIVLGPAMKPIKEGTSHEFWYIAAGVSLSAQDQDHFGHAYVVDATWAAYDHAHMHGSDLYCVPLRHVTADLENATAQLASMQERQPQSDSVKGYIAWRDDRWREKDVANLINSIEKERFLRLAARDPQVVSISAIDTMIFNQRWQRAHWFWACYAFEWTFLSGLVLFAIWAGIRNYPAWGWVWRSACVPFLFMLPAYLGYATMSFTSGGPQGGIVYPFLLSTFRRGSCNEFDQFALRYTPQVLEPLSCSIGVPMSLTGMGMPGPTSAISVGLALAGMIVWFRVFSDGWKHNRSSKRLELQVICHEQIIG